MAARYRASMVIRVLDSAGEHFGTCEVFKDGEVRELAGSWGGASFGDFSDVLLHWQDTGEWLNGLQTDTVTIKRYKR